MKTSLFLVALFTLVLRGALKVNPHQRTLDQKVIFLAKKL